MTLDEIHEALATAQPEDWLLYDEQASAALRPDLRLVVSWAFPRDDEGGNDLGEPWTAGYPAVWRGHVTL